MDKIEDMGIKMLNGNILAELQGDNKQANGLYIPDNKAYKVVKVVESSSEEAKEGDILYVLKHVGTELEIESVKYIVVNVGEIILIV